MSLKNNLFRAKVKKPFADAQDDKVKAQYVKTKHRMLKENH